MAVKDLWESGDPYEYFMGRWSRLVARAFVAWLTAPAASRWLDVGCGTGALSAAILERQQPSRLVAVDQSQGFVDAARQRLGDAADCRVGDAMALSFADASFDRVVSGLVLNFIPEPVTALREMKRVTAAGGAVAVYVWDYPGNMGFLKHFWDAAVELDPGAAELHEGNRFPQATVAGLGRLFEQAGLAGAGVEAIEIETRFENFDDFWQPFLGAQGPAPTYVLALGEPERARLRDLLHQRLPIARDGSISLDARAWAARAGV